MILTLKDAKDYLRVEQDDTTEDAFITTLIESAELYIKNGTDKTFDATNELAKLATKILITHWFENRSPVIVGSITKEIEYSIKSIMLQLTYCEGGVTT